MQKLKWSLLQLRSFTQIIRDVFQPSFHIGLNDRRSKDGGQASNQWGCEPVFRPQIDRGGAVFFLEHYLSAMMETKTTPLGGP